MLKQHIKSLDEIGLDYQVQKSSRFHDFCKKYEKYLPFERRSNLKILEIGVKEGRSLQMWREYYFNSTVVGIDINSLCKNHENFDKNIYIEIGSQDDKFFLSQIIEKHGPFDFIIDDGSHIQYQVIQSFDCLFPALNSGGVYAIEDTHCAYWKEYGGQPNAEHTAISYMKKLVDDVNFFGQKLTERVFHQRKDEYLIEQILKNKDNIRIDIESINFINGIVLVTKR